MGDKKGHVLRSMRRISDNRVVTQHVRLNEGAQEILFRTVKKGEESNDECVLALRTEPLRCEFHCRSAKDEMRVLSKEPACLCGRFLIALSTRLKFRDEK